MNWKLLALPVSIVPFVIIAVTFNISIENLLAVGIIPFAGASVAMACKLFTQGLKFNYLVKKFLGPVDVNWKTISVRIGSEFVTSTTPSFVGGELVRIMWLSKKGVPVGKASWVTIIEIVTEAFGVSMIISLFTWSFYGLSFMIIANGAGYVIDFFHALLSTMASNAIGNIPITIGGSGLTEFAIWAYIGHLNTLAFGATKNSLQWNIVIVWRIATYHVGLVISWLFLIDRKSTRLNSSHGYISYAVFCLE